ncbi:polymorphic toxin-type HINT domain-containing protein [Hellea sp.]|nr:polymorphic toxin-type HINT domain-containing protein [Hellea sp.]
MRIEFGIKVFFVLSLFILGFSFPSVAQSDPQSTNSFHDIAPDDIDDDPAENQGVDDDEIINPFPVGDIQARYNSLDFDVLDDGLVGDNIDLDTGSVSFSQMDVSIPGNSGLPVQFGRTLSRSSLRTGMIGNYWAPQIPYISRNYTTHNSQTYGKALDRCSGEIYPPSEEISLNGEATYLRAEAYFNGYKIDVPGKNPGTLVEARGNNNVIYSDEFNTTGAYFVSTENWYVDCITSIPAGGEGYKAHAPNGDIYEFTHLVESDVRNFEFGGSNFPVTAETLYVTEITDVHGNWVRFEYSGANLTRIHSNDLREIDFTYSNGRLASVDVHATSNTTARSWDYHYTNGNLSRVDLPDGRYWTFTSNGNDLLAVDPLTTRDICFKIPVPSIEIRHPSGTIVEYDFEVIRNGRKDVIFRQENYPWINQSLHSGPESAPNQAITDCNDDGDLRSKLPSSFWSFAVIEKRLILSDGSTHIWEREYQEDKGSYNYPSSVTPWAPYDANLTDTKTRTVTDPEGHKTVTYINRRFGRQEGQIVKVEVIPSGQTTPIKTIEYDYLEGNLVGSSLGARDHGYTGADSTRVYQTESVISQNGDTFTTQTDYNTVHTASSFSYGYPTERRSWSSYVISNSNNLRKTETDYVHYKTKWVLGNPTKVTQNDLILSTYGYHNNGLLVWKNQYGQRVATYEHHTATTDPLAIGMVSSFKDGENRITKAENWHRGQPKTITRASGTPLQQVTSFGVNDNGWGTSVTDPAGYTTTYQRDSMGRLTKIIPHTPPAGTYKLVATNISYNFSGGGAVQTIKKGPRWDIITYDSMFRPILSETKDIGTGISTYVNTDYDALSRVTFESFPSLSSTSLNGSDTRYDALGRVTETEIDSATTKYSYLNGHRSVVEDPLGNETVTRRYGYDGPDAGDTYLIQQEEDIDTYIFRDIHGEIDRVTQTGTQNGLTVNKTQYFYYNNQSRVCRYRTSEGGDTVYEYNNTGELIAYQKGLAASTSCTSPITSNRVELTYNILGRLKDTLFSDAATPDISRDYDLNGNLTKLYRGLNTAKEVKWDYTYDSYNRLTNEDLTIAGASQGYDIWHRYNAFGYLFAERLPSSKYVSYTNDGLGRATKVNSGSAIYAQNASYHPSGALAGMTFGNDNVFSQTLNARLLPERLKVMHNGTDKQNLLYDYYADGRVYQKLDYVDPTYSAIHFYDGAGRLSAANSTKWGGANYSYDALGNLRSKTFSNWNGTGSRTVTNSYNAKNQISSSHDTINSLYSFTHDTRGNVIQTGNLHFTYDLSDQPVAMNGTAPNTGTSVDTTYLYDGNNKRVRSIDTVSGKTIYNVYDAAGRLIHVDNATDGEETDYLHGMGQTLARIKNGVFTYLHPDHLGSAVLGTTETGTTAFNERYTPFGEALIDAAANDNQSGFTGHIKDKSTGLNYMQARYYDPNIGRFLSVDPVTFLETGEPGMFNRYAYTWNDPINATDPDGEFLKIVKSVYNVGKRTYKNGGNFKGALKDEALSYVENGATLLSKNASLGDKAFAIFDLATGFGDEAKGAKRLLGGCCFVAGTLVETEDGLRPIEDIKVGDLVLSRNPETGETAYKQVTAFIPRHDRIIWTVVLSGENNSSESFETTDEHPWWVISEAGVGSWKRTDELSAGMIATTAGYQTMTITSALKTERLDGTYNITVADFETYFVGENKVLVHNCGRTGKQARLKEMGQDPKLGKADRGWIKQEQNSIARGQRKNIRVPPGKEMAHERGREAAKGYDYKHSNLQNKADHKAQHKYDNNGRSNMERPVE